MLLGDEACTDVGVLENCDKFLQENLKKSTWQWPTRCCPDNFLQGLRETRKTLLKKRNSGQVYQTPEGKVKQQS